MKIQLTNFGNHECKICGNVTHSFATFNRHFNTKHSNDLSMENYCNIHGIHEIKNCRYCDNRAKFISYSVGYSETCGCECCVTKFKHDRTVESIKTKYGVTNPSQINGIPDKVKQTKLERYGNPNYCNIEQAKQTNVDRYGVECYLKTDECITKRKNTSLDKYGTEHPSKSELVKNKSRLTCLEKYGVPYVLQDKNIRDQIKETVALKYGGFTLESKELRAKMQNTMVERYGVQHAQQNIDIQKQTKQTNLLKYGHVMPCHSTKLLMERYMVDKVCNIPGLTQFQIERRIGSLKQKYGVCNVSQLGWVQDKIKVNNTEKYGVDSTSKLQDVKDKIVKTTHDRYGVNNVMQFDEFYFKQQKSLNVGYKLTEYNTIFGDVVYYQSIPELNFIKFCEASGTRILNGDTIEYTSNNKLRKYRIDFKIIDTSGIPRLIEIKRKHKWWYKSLADGTMLSKCRSAQKYSKDMGFLPYKIIFHDK